MGRRQAIIRGLLIAFPRPPLVGFYSRLANKEGPSTECFRTLVPKTIMGMALGARVPKDWVLGLPGKDSRQPGYGASLPRCKGDWMFRKLRPGKVNVGSSTLRCGINPASQEIDAFEPCMMQLSSGNVGGASRRGGPFRSRPKNHQYHFEISLRYLILQLYMYRE